MANELTTHSQPLRLGSPSSLSEPERRRAATSQCDQVRLTRAIRDLLAIGWQSNDTPEERARQVAIYVRDIAEFSDWVVHSAIDDWRKNQDRKPSPAALRNVCLRYKGKVFDAPEPPPPERQPPTPEEVERVQAKIVEFWPELKRMRG